MIDIEDKKKHLTELINWELIDTIQDFGQEHVDNKYSCIVNVRCYKSPCVNSEIVTPHTFWKFKNEISEKKKTLFSLKDNKSQFIEKELKEYNFEKIYYYIELKRQR